MNYHVVTIFPGMFDSYLSESMIGRAIKKKTISVSFYNPMDYLEDSPHGKLKKRVDDKPYGGGPGMVIRLDPVVRAMKSAIGRKKNYQVIYFSPRAEKFDTTVAKYLATKFKKGSGGYKKGSSHIIFVCGRYEGIDSRIEEIFPGKAYSVGDFVLTGGELPAMVMIDSISRQLPGFLGDADSREEERVSAARFYTRPAVYRYQGSDYKVPSVLLDGNHASIEKWRKENQDL